MEKKNKAPENGIYGSCESCEHYDYDADSDSYFCGMDLDEDEMCGLLQKKNACPYYRYYDEYKFVHKQI